MTPLLLLVCSNIFMTIAWYGHLKFTDARLWVVIVASWGIALIEYCFAVPANRIGYMHGWSAGQLKITQEIITLLVFAVFALLVLKEPIGLRHLGAFCCLIGAAAFMFAGK
ncbi:DMT family protein [Sphingomonas montanisoli]|uniref:DMT family protein n=1 Tax=Sphingomonas montanisoli TaxID=2606412 RepID=A0A5D9C0T2_9SPHN|nr:DMT family protein [Sphingomonas montanisoli]TZG25239.1 DMT family protein [Sphingomonas montanisoli]